MPNTYGHQSVPVFTTAADKFSINRYDLDSAFISKTRMMIAARNPARVGLRIENIGVSPANAFICNRTAISSQAGYQLFGRPTTADYPEVLDLDVTDEVWAIVPSGAATTLIVLERIVDIAPIAY